MNQIYNRKVNFTKSLTNLLVAKIK